MIDRHRAVVGARLMIVVIMWCGPAGSVPPVGAADPVPDFETEIAPLLVKRCLECHQATEAAGGLALTTRGELLRGGDSGAVVEPGQPADSYLLQRVQSGEMPPEKRGQSQRLPASELQLLERWIAAGAGWPEARQLDWFESTSEVRAGRDWWALQKVVRPAVPERSDSNWAANPIDAFVGARLQAAGMQPARPAARRVLIRRLYYDLIGLPPTAEQVEAFVADTSPLAWQRQVDRLLASPQYGERWTRYWLDLVRYADTSGYERDQDKPFAWKFRDWVVAALNDDMPYRKFVLAQLAGDEIDAADQDSLIATGFLRLGAWNDEPNDPADYQYDRLEDIVHTTASTFLGLTVKCARCHDHKFDPIMQADYYRFASAFWPGPIAARDRDLLGGPTAEELGCQDVLGWTDLPGQPTPLHVLKNGQREHPLEEVTPGTLSSIPSLQRSFDPPQPSAKTSARRLQLANWITDLNNPLTTRVIVNRLWQHHFGAGIVRTPNNFGFLADPPSHPQLLDWLAAELMQSGGSLKHIHRLILTSRTWQQASLHPQAPKYAVIDPQNRLCWRATRRRLDAEAIRDSMLTVAGQLDQTMGGESFRPTVSPEALEGLSRKSDAWQASAPAKQRRRSLYMFLKRGLLPPLMTTFDLCDPTASCGKRDVTTVPTQALAMLNNPFVHQCSEFLASRILDQEPRLDDQVAAAYLRILRRSPSDSELQWSCDHLREQRQVFESSRLSLPADQAEGLSPHELALASLCHVLMNTNEFVYID